MDLSLPCLSSATRRTIRTTTTSTDSVDTPGYIDYDYASDMTRGVVGYLATEAVAVPEPSTIILLAVGVVALLVRARQSRGTRRAA